MTPAGATNIKADIDYDVIGVAIQLFTPLSYSPIHEDQVPWWGTLPSQPRSGFVTARAGVFRAGHNYLRALVNYNTNTCQTPDFGARVRLTLTYDLVVADPSPQPSPSPSPTPTPIALKLGADNPFSPNGDNSKDTCGLSLTVPADKPWALTVDGQPGVIKSSTDYPGQSAVAFDWDGKLNGAVLPDGRYTLRLKAGTQEKSEEVIIDNAKPTITITSLKAQSWASDGASLVMTGSASVEDVGLAGLDPARTKFKVDGAHVSSAPPPIVSADGKQIDFTFTVTPPTRRLAAYRLSAIDEPDAFEAGTVALNASLHRRHRMHPHGGVVHTPFSILESRVAA